MHRWPSDLVDHARRALNDLPQGEIVGNATPGRANDEAVEWNSVIDMEVFDRLPVGVRYALNYSDLCYSSAQALLFAAGRGIGPADFGYSLITKFAMPSRDRPNPFTWLDRPHALAAEAMR